MVPSPALAQVTGVPGPIAGRVVGVVAGPRADLAAISKLRDALEARGALLRVIGSRGGVLVKGVRKEIVERTLLTTRSIEYDALLIAGGAGDLADVKLTVLVQEAFRHAKPIGAWGDGGQALRTAGVDVTAPGVLLADGMTAAYRKQLLAALGLHRVWERTPLVMAAAAPSA